MNVDPNRPRVMIPELDQNKLRRVAFSVDVEIAGGPKYKDDASEAERKKKFKEQKLKEKGEGAALKHPQAVADEKEKDGIIKESSERVGTEDAPNPEGSIVDDDKEKSDKKKDKKKKSEEERKARKEEKRRKAEDNGTLPMQINRGVPKDDDASSIATPASATPVPGTPVSSTAKRNDRPTTDPLRMYRRCCQLRETPILKRITEQLAKAEVCPQATPGVVTILDLTGSRLTLADVITLSDWLAIVPVKKLLMEDADLGDEGVRVVLAGLLAAVMPDEPRHRIHSNSVNQIRYEERSGVIEKLSLKNNPKITKEGWKHISLFIYMCKSIKALDLSMIFFPASPPPQVNGHHGTDGEDLAAHNSNDSQTSHSLPQNHPEDLAEIFSKALSERRGGRHLEELILAECALTSNNLHKIIDGVTTSGVSRLVVANNNIDDDGFDSILGYIKSGVCQGIDLGGNNLRDKLGKLAKVFTTDTEMWALSLADCNLEPASLKYLWPGLVQLPNLRFIDFSHNPELFGRDPSALAGFRKYLPRLKLLKRIHLIDVNMSPAQAINLAEIIPECPQLCHINILQNPQISALASATDEEQQEEACALYASLMVAARVSSTLIAVDIDVPSGDNSDVVKALAKQIIAYCLRNMDNFTSEIPDVNGNVGSPNGVDGKEAKEVKIPDVLLHLVGHSEGQVDLDADDAPDNDYIVSGNGLIKALSYCLSERASDSRRKSLPVSGTATPTANQRMASIAGNTLSAGGAKNVSKNLLDSARKIRTRLQPALVREAKAGDDMAYRKFASYYSFGYNNTNTLCLGRLLFLDNTLRGVIQRFEDEYPETRLAPPDAKPDTISETSVSPPNSVLSSSNSKELGTSAGTSIVDGKSLAAESDEEAEGDDEERPTLRSRHNSDVSLAARALSIEEGQAHRLGAAIKRTFLRPQSEDHLHQTTGSEEELAAEPPHLRALRVKLESISGDEWRRIVERHGGFEAAFKDITAKAEELKRLREEDPEEFKRVEDVIRERWETAQGFDKLEKADDVAVDD